MEYECHTIKPIIVGLYIIVTCLLSKIKFKIHSFLNLFKSNTFV